MIWLWLILAVVILGVTTAVAAGWGDRLRAAYPDRPDVRLPAGRILGAQDLPAVQFSVVLRGYRMDEVDDLVGRLTREIAVRDAELARLSSRPDGPGESGAADSHNDPAPPGDHTGDHTGEDAGNDTGDDEGGSEARP